MKKYAFILIIIATIQTIQAQESGISGFVITEEKKPIPFANIVILEKQLSLNADKAGKFTIEDAGKNKLTLKVYLEGFHTETVEIDPIDKKDIVVVLHRSGLSSSTIVITGRSRLSDQLTSPQSVNVVEGRNLERRRGQNITSLIQGTPGVSAVTTGPGIAKPVIRGLSGQRILTLTDGIRQEDQQFGDEHSLEIDSVAVKKIEVLKGPASLLYGSDALGGVINVIRQKAPNWTENTGALAGNVFYQMQSENNSDASALDVYGKANTFGYRAIASTRKGGKLETPRGRLPNTGFTEENKSVSLANGGKWGSFYLDAFQRKQTQDVYKNPNESQGEMLPTPSQILQHDKTHLNSVFEFSAGTLETDIAYQRNKRREKPDKNLVVADRGVYLDPAVDENVKLAYLALDSIYQEKNGLNVNLDSSSADVRFHRKEKNGLKGTVGVSGIQQRNNTIGTEPLIPNYLLHNFAAYWLEEYRNKRWTFSAGIRTDKRSISVSDNEELKNQKETRNYYANTGSTGAVYRTSKYSAIAVNYGIGYRAPTVFEMYANGVHEGSGRFEVGKSNLKPEYSKSIELSLRYGSHTARAELNLYRNTIDNFIYSISAHETDLVSNLPIYLYRQDRATISGAELDFEKQFAEWFLVLGGANIVRGRNEHTTNWLPFMPANNGNLGFRLLKRKLGKLYQPYFELKGRFYDRQTLVDPTETISPAYNLYDVGVGWEIQSFGKESQNATFDLNITNIFNKAYADHLNRYRAYALNAGTSVSFKFTMPFSFLEATK